MISIRKIGVIGRTYRHLNRYRQIVTIIIKYGFGDLIERLGIEQYFEIGYQFFAGHKRENVEKLSKAERYRLLLEELGPTFIKLGQILSTRPDLVTADIIMEFAKLQDEVPPFDFEEARRSIIHDLGDIDAMFDYIEEKPIASASIGQVHRAALLDGDVVAIKVKRPGIRRIIEIDLEIMLHLATLMENNIEEFALHKPVKIVEEFASTLEKEIDYHIEAGNIDRIAQQFLKDKTVYIPKVYHEYSSDHILTMEYIDGIKISDIDALLDQGYDRKKINQRGADFILQQVFEYGFFHADPHPGNVFVMPGNVVCPVDFGMVGSIGRRQRELFIDLIESVARKNTYQVARLLLQIAEYDEKPNMKQFEKQIDEFMGRHLFKSLKDIDVGRLLYDFLDIATQNRLRVPPDIFLMMKAFTSVEGISRLLDPEFDMVSYAAPYIKKIKLARYSPQRIAGDIFATASDFARLFRLFPGEVIEISRLIRNEKLFINFEMKGLERMLKTHDQISNRLSFSIVIGALIMGSAMILSSEVPPLFYGISLIGIIGFSAAAILGIWLLIAILKKGKL